MSRYDKEKKANKTVCFLGRGDNFGEAAIMDKVPRDCTVISKERVELFCLSEEVRLSRVTVRINSERVGYFENTG